jgi:hypothetical protein
MYDKLLPCRIGSATPPAALEPALVNQGEERFLAVTAPALLALASPGRTLDALRVVAGIVRDVLHAAAKAATAVTVEAGPRRIHVTDLARTTAAPLGDAGGALVRELFEVGAFAAFAVCERIVAVVFAPGALAKVAARHAQVVNVRLAAMGGGHVGGEAHRPFHALHWVSRIALAPAWDVADASAVLRFVSDCALIRLVSSVPGLVLHAEARLGCHGLAALQAVLV